MPLRLIKHKGLRSVVARATEKKRAKRFQSAAEFRVALDRMDPIPSPFPRPFYIYAIGGAAVAAVAAALLLRKPSSPHDSTPEPVKTEVAASDYPSTVAALYDSTSASEALQNLQTLSDKGDARATFLLSRLRYSYKPYDFCPDSIRQLQQSLHVAHDDVEAHQLLLKAVRQDGNDYHSLYELACDYWKADQRTEAVQERDGGLAKSYFDKAREYAAAAGDQKYVSMIDNYLQEYERWDENVRRYKLKVN